MSRTRFPREVIRKLKHYVYLYLDPDNEEIFYVGKGTGNRAFAHLDETESSEKTRRIKRMRRRGREPRIEILVHGLANQRLAQKVEAAVIDLIGVGRLSNEVRGWGSGIYGRMDVSEVVSLYSHEEARITEPAILIRINQLYRYGMTPTELYDVTRGIWRIGENRTKARFAFPVFAGIIKEVYRIERWFPAGSTFTTREDLSPRRFKGRWEFVGRIAGPSMRRKYINKSARKYFPRYSQTPIRYVNIDTR